MKRYFALLLAAAMLLGLALPVSAAEATYKVADVSQVGYLEDEDGRLDLSDSVSKVPYGETVYFPLLNDGGSAGITEAYNDYVAKDNAYGAAQNTTRDALATKNEKQNAFDAAKAAWEAANGDTTALQQALTNAQNALTELETKISTLTTEIAALEAELPALQTALESAQNALSGKTSDAELANLKTAMDNAQSIYDQAVTLDADVTAKQAAYDAIPATDSGLKDQAYNALIEAQNARSSFNSKTTAELQAEYNSAMTAYNQARNRNESLDAQYSTAQTNLTNKQNEISAKKTEKSNAEADKPNKQQAVDDAQAALNAVGDVTEAKKKMDDAQRELTEATTAYNNAVTAETSAKTARDEAKAKYDSLRNNRYPYVYESAAAGSAKVSKDWEENGSYVDDVEVIRKRVSDSYDIPGSTSSSMNYIYCVAVTIKSSSSTSDRDLFGQITVKQTSGDRENRFEDVVLDLAIEIGYLDAEDTEVGAGVIPEEPATFRRGSGFEQDSEFVFEFEADSHSTFVVNTIGQGTITLGMNTDPDDDLSEAIYDEYGVDVDFFNGNYGTFNRTGTLYLCPSSGEDDYYVYAIDEDGDVSRVSADWDSYEDGYAIRTRTLGRYFLSPQRLSNSFLSSINGTSSSGSSSGSGSGSSSSGNNAGDLVIVPAPSTPSTSTPSTSTPTYNPPASSSSSPSSSSSSSSSEASSEPEESEEEADDPVESEPEELVDVDAEQEDEDGPQKGGSVLLWVLLAVGLIAVAGVVGFLIYQNRVRREDDGYSQYDEYNDDGDDFPDDDDQN